MKYRRLGASGTRVSEIALGNWITHGGQIDKQRAQDCVHAALDAGINFFDTADVYERGKAETVLGEALKGVERSHVVVATKVFWPMSRNITDRGLSRKHIIESIDKSLKRLQMDYVDLYQAHRYDRRVPLQETLRGFDDLVRRGKVLHIGVSEWTAEQITEALRIADDMGFDRLVTNQPQYNMLWRVPEARVMEVCRREDIGQIVWSPLAMGVLTGKYEPGKPPPKESRADVGGAVNSEYLSDRTLRAVQALKPLAESIGLSLAQLSLAWVLQNDNVSAAISGATRPEQMGENAKASGVELDETLLKEIDNILADVIVSDPDLTG